MRLRHYQLVWSNKRHQVGTSEAIKLIVHRVKLLLTSRFMRRRVVLGASSETAALVQRLVRQGQKSNGRTRDAWLSEVLELAEDHLVSREEALVTVVIPSFNRPDELLACLHSLVLWPIKVQTHVIVSDDASTNFDPSLWPTTTGITVLRNVTNQGYVNNVNRAVTYCSSTYVLTLNQDTICFPDAVDELVLAIEETESTHIVGPMVLSTSFNIQEVGGDVDPTGEAAHRGRGELAIDPRWSFSQNVTYVSGCAMLLHRSTWIALNGLDEVFAPAYYDDTDLCLRAWASGLGVRVIPTAMIVHREGTTMGRNPSDVDSLKHHQFLNRAVCALRNAEILSAIALAEPPPLVCFVAERPPIANRDGGSLDFDLFMRYSMQQGVRVRLLVRHEYLAPESLPLRRAGIGCALIGSSEGREWLDEAALLISMGVHAGIDVLKTVRCHFSGPWVHFTSDVATRRLQSAGAIDTKALPAYTDLPSEPSSMWQLEASVYSSADEVLFVSTEDRAFAHELGYPNQKGTVFPIMRGEYPPLGVIAPNPEPVVSFVGSMTHAPNVDAVDWFIRTSWIEVHEHLPDALFCVWGSGLSSHLHRRWASVPGVSVRGAFADWADVANETRVTVAPLRFGAGVKGKVVSSLQWGVPVVGTPVAFDGLPLPTVALSCRSINQLTSKLLATLTDDCAWRSALEEGRRALGDEFTPEVESTRVMQLLKRHGILDGTVIGTHEASRDLNVRYLPSPIACQGQ